MTYDEYTAAVIAEIIRQTGWTNQQAWEVVVDLRRMMEVGLTPAASPP